jgi:DNA-binding transcriptional ArsR family regulator
LLFSEILNVEGRPVSEVYRALADPTRRRILALLRERERSAGEIAGHFDLAKPTLSGHFAVLREAGLVTPMKAGTTITYHLNVSVLEEALLALMDVFKLQAAGARPAASEPHRSNKGETR